MTSTRALAALLFSALSCLPCGAAAQHGAPTGPAREYVEEPVGPDEARMWREDLAAMIPEMERLHADLYHTVGRAELADAVTELDGRIPTLAAHEIVVELARIVAMIGDGHTSLPLDFAPGVGFRPVPVRFGLYPEGLVIEAADRAHADLVGGRVVTIGGVPAEDAVARAAPLVSRDAPMWVDATVPRYLERIEVLHALGLAGSLDGVDIVVERDGDRRSGRVVPVDDDRSASMRELRPEYTPDWVDASEEEDRPVYRSRADEPVVEFVRDSILYVGFPAMANGERESARAFFRRAMETARGTNAWRVVIDLRNNRGGEGGLIPGIVREIVRAREIDAPGRLFVAIGRHVFSAAGLLTTDLERYTRAIFVGEPTGTSPNMFGNHSPVRLPNSGIELSVSPVWFQHSWPFDDRETTVPDLHAPPTFAAYLENRDPVLDVVAEYDPEGLERKIAEARHRGRAAVTEVVRAFARDPVHRFVAEPRINAAGYRLLRSGDVEGAILVFRANVAVHPEYGNGWDSLGEALAEAGRRDEAIEAYERALAIEPTPWTRAKLERLLHSPR